MQIHIQLLNDEIHDRAGFTCGNAVMDRYFRTTVLEDISDRMADCYAAINEKDELVALFTLSSFSIERQLVSGVIRRSRYDPVPAMLIGRLGVAKQFQRLPEHVGTKVLAAICKLIKTIHVGCKLVAVHPMDADEGLIGFYEKAGFVSLRRTSHPICVFEL